MELRRLRPEEQDKTRRLWEEIFTEDTKEFLDYYYTVKTKENEIYVIEEDGSIRSMIHLNPYRMRIGSQIYETHYIVAVATEEPYRRRGYMAALLNHVMQVMKDRGEPFTFLMPASEAIYKPFGFSFIYEQKRGIIPGKKGRDSSLEAVLAEGKDCEMIADFANEILQKYEICTWRDSSYYEMLLAEQRSEGGGILLIKKEGSLRGVFCFAKAENDLGVPFEMREPLCYRREDLEHAIWHLTKCQGQAAFCTGYGEEKKPMIMGKILNEDLLGDLGKDEKDLLRAGTFLNEVV